MKKCVFVNLDVGSAIEQSGGEVIENVKTIKDLDISVFTDQTREDIFFKFLVNKSPDIIIINGNYPRIIVPAIYYKLLYTNTKIIFISRVIEDFIKNKSLNDNYSIFDDQEWNIFTDICDLIICVNSCGKFKTHVPDLSYKTIDCCGLNNISKFEILKEWNDRQNKFIMPGSLNDVKVSPRFIKLLEDTDIKIDCYGFLRQEKMKSIIENSPNLEYKGFCEFENMPELLNEYKYSIFPHNGREGFCNTLQQSILCGTIPLVLDDWYTNFYGDYWLHWANDLYIGNNTEEELINTIEDKLSGENDENFSYEIRDSLIKRYNLDSTFDNIVTKIRDISDMNNFKWMKNI